MISSKPIICASIALLGLLPAHGEILINEIMQSNVYTTMDDLNDFPDSWVELYNPSDAPVNLYGYRISVKDKFNSAYILPSVSIAPGGLLLIYCDKVGDSLHTDFRVDSGKGDIYLYDADGIIIDHVNLKKQPAPEVAYGRESDGSSVWGYELKPTPGLPNSGGTSATVLGNVTFSSPGGVWAKNQDMEISLSLPKNAPAGSKIIYTTDGAEPTIHNSIIYESPISISQSTVIRAKAVADGCISIPSDVQSYIFLDREMDLPVISLAIDEKYLYNDTIGIFARGLIGELNENYRQNWRRPLNLEYFESEGSNAALNQLCETRVHGGLSRTNKLKSLAVYANKRFGTKNFGYPLWKSDKPDLKVCKSFLLRNAGNDFDGAYMRDGLIQRVIGRNTTVDWQAFSPVIVYINGNYHAMMAVRERSNEDYVAANYDGLEDIDMFETWDEYKEGDPAAADEFKDFVYGNHTFEEWCQYINIESFANLIAINYWVYNTDFPMNNVVMWRRTDGVDGRWQWIVKDCDYGLGIWNDTSYIECNYDRFLYSNVNIGPYVGFDIYQILMTTEFRDYFINRLIVYMGDFLNAKTINAYIDEILDVAKGEMAISHTKWGSGWSNLDTNHEFLRSWVAARQSYMPTLMQGAWWLGTPVKVSVNNELNYDDLKSAGIRYNDVPLSHGVFDGVDYNGRSITLSGADNKVSGWVVNIGSEQSTIMEPVLNLTLNTNDDVTINAILNDAGISNPEVDGGKISFINGLVFAEGLIEAYDTTGRKVAHGYDSLSLPSKGIYIVHANGVTKKYIW